MSNLAKKLSTSHVDQRTGEVVAREQSAFVVRVHGRVFHARRAVSCLVEPEVGDTVLVASTEAGASYILAVLERESRATRVSVDGDLEISVGQGKLSLAAQHGMELASAHDLTMVAGSLQVSAVEGALTLETLTVLTSLLRAEITRVKASGSTIDATFERVSQRLERSFRTVTELDQVRAESIDYAAQKNLSLHGENALVTAEELVKIDGEQIHVG